MGILAKYARAMGVSGAPSRPARAAVGSVVRADPPAPPRLPDPVPAKRPDTGHAGAPVPQATSEVPPMAIKTVARPGLLFSAYTPPSGPMSVGD